VPKQRHENVKNRRTLAVGKWDKLKVSGCEKLEEMVKEKRGDMGKKVRARSNRFALEKMKRETTNIRNKCTD
jgi:hypothetical protein